MSDFLLKDKVILITGGSKGIGFAITEVLAISGAKVVICNRNEEEGMESVKKIKEKGFRYNEVDDRWQRVWATVIPDGIETVLEVCKKDGEGWKYILYDNNENLFYEELVDD